MKDTIRTGITRRTFLQRAGTGIATVGLLPLAPSLTGCPPVPTGLLFGKEMVGNVTSSASTIRLVAGDECTSSKKFKLLYDTTSRSNPGDYQFQTSEVSGFTTHDPITFELSSLTPSTPYYYRVAYDEGSGWNYRDEYSFRTRRGSGESFRFCLAADTHIYQFSSPSMLNTLAYQNVCADRPDILLTMGDDYFVALQAAEPYLIHTRDEFLSAWKMTRSVFDNAGHSMLCLPLNGNHEGLYGWTTHLPEYMYALEGKLRYFPLPDSDTYPEGGDQFGRYGAFTWGDVLFVWLDSVGFCQIDPAVQGGNADYILSATQRDFLETTLAGSSATWKFVFAHHLFGGIEECTPRYGRGNANGAHLFDQAYLQNLMVQHGVQAFFYGHDHAFSISEADGVKYICTGHAGSTCPWVDTLEACYVPYLLFTKNGEGNVPAGHVRVDVTPTETTVSYILASAGSDNRSTLASYTIYP